MTPRGPVPETLYEYDLSAETASVLFDCSDPCVGDDEPAYSPDGTEVLMIRALDPFTSDGPADCGLWIGEVSTGEVRQITSNDGCNREYDPRWSPDVTRIAYAREKVNGSVVSDAIFLIDANGSRDSADRMEHGGGIPRLVSRTANGSSLSPTRSSRSATTVRCRISTGCNPTARMSSS